MNIRLRFKLIALLIVLSLAGLLVFQGYWLKGLYDTLALVNYTVANLTL